MNVNDGDVVWSILSQHGYEKTKIIDEANIILLVTCSIRENAEAKIWSRLNTLHKLKKNKLIISNGTDKVKIGLLGKVILFIFSTMKDVSLIRMHIFSRCRLYGRKTERKSSRKRPHC